MKSRAKSEVSQRRQPTKRVGLSRNVFDFRYWVSGWGNPFESRWSVYQKYVWLNDASPHEYIVLTATGKESNHQRLETRLFSAVLEQHRIPYIKLWDAAQFSHAVCPICLGAGYWSELPQMAGLEECPLHGTPLQRHCRKCLRPIWFGCPQFAKTSAFVCQSCGEPLTSFPKNVFMQWHSISPDALISKFAPLYSIAQRLSAECQGIWRFPGYAPVVEVRLILHLFTCHRTRLDRDAHWPTFAEEVSEQVSPATFLLPFNANILTAELEQERRATITDLTRQCRQIPYGDRRIGETLTVNMGWKTHELDFKTGGALPENVMSVLNSLSNGRVKKSHWSFEDDLYSSIALHFPDAPYLKQVPKILLTFSVWQICRILMRIESLVRTLTERLSGSGGMNDDAHNIIGHQPYGIRLKWGRVDEGHFVFELNSSAWIPPYRLRNTARGIELTIFQILPSFDLSLLD